MNAAWHAHRYLVPASLADASVSREEHVVDGLREIARELRPADADGTDAGVYLLTEDGGVDTSIAFWRDSLRAGPAFANPRRFPQTLANYLATQIAASADLRGANYTLAGDARALPALFEQAVDDLECGVVRTALVGAADLRLGEAALVLLARAGVHRAPIFAHLAVEPLPGRATEAARWCSGAPGAALRVICMALELSSEEVCLAEPGVRVVLSPHGPRRRETGRLRA